MAKDEPHESYESAFHEVYDLKKMEKELEIQIPQSTARVVEGNPQKIALQSLRHLDYKMRRVYELHLGLTGGRIEPMSFSEIAKSMDISQSSVQRLFKRAEAHLGSHTQSLEEMAEALRKEKVNMKDELDLEKIAAELSPIEFEVLEMVAEGRTWAEAGRETGIGGQSGAAKLRSDLAKRIGINPLNILKMEEIAPELVRLHIEEREKNK